MKIISIQFKAKHSLWKHSDKISRANQTEVLKSNHLREFKKNISNATAAIILITSNPHT